MNSIDAARLHFGPTDQELIDNGFTPEPTDHLPDYEHQTTALRLLLNKLTHQRQARDQLRNLDPNELDKFVDALDVLVVLVDEGAIRRAEKRP